MATATAPQSNGITPATQQYGQAFNRITRVPLVAESLNVAHSTLESYPILAQPYHLGNAVVSHSLKAAEPVTTRLQPQLALLDTYAVKGLDFAESKWSYPFKATPNDVYKDARQPADQALSFFVAYAQAAQKAYEERVFGPAKSIYDSRVAPAYDSANAQFQELKNQNAYLQRATEVVSNLQTNLAKTLDSISGRGKAEGDAAAQKAQGISNAIFAEVSSNEYFSLLFGNITLMTFLSFSSTVSVDLPFRSQQRVANVFTQSWRPLQKPTRN